MTNQRLIGTENRIEKLLENSFFGLILLDTSLAVIYGSYSAHKILGWQDTGLPKGSFTNTIHPDDLPHVSVLLSSVLANGPTQSSTFRLQHACGKYIWVQCTFTNLLNEPEIEAVACNFADITAQKRMEADFRQQTEQISGLLETMTDGFIALDENLCYTYVNKQVLTMLSMDLSAMIGKHIWDVFQNQENTATYKAIQKAFAEKIYICNEDFYPTAQRWQENRIYPSAGGISMFIRDITKQKKEDHHLKLLESVITNTTDAVLITEAEPFDEPGPRILYVNEAFTRMTGYTAEEVIGKTPRLLQGPKTDKAQLGHLSKCLRNWEPCESTLINYKKSGEAFWVNFTVTPVADEKGWYTHWISVERDVTKRKTEEIQAALLADTSIIFNDALALPVLLDKLLQRLVAFGNFSMAEVWLIGADKNKITLTSHLSDSDEMKDFYLESAQFKSFVKGEGLPGTAWATGNIQFWDNLGERKDFLRRDAAKKAGLAMAYSIPLIADNITIGALLLGLGTDRLPDDNWPALFEKFSTHFGTEIRRKQLEQNLNQVFNFAPDIICIIGADGYFKKVNPAMCRLLGYSKEEILAKPLFSLLHPDDRDASRKRLHSFSRNEQTLSFENRFLHKSGKVIWLSWTASNSAEEGLVFAVGKDITDKIELKNLLDKVAGLAMVGGWELNVKKGTLFWSKITKQLHEVEPDYEPTAQTGASFYREGHDRDTIIRLMQGAIQNGTPIDVELQIITAKGNIRWVRVVSESEFVNGECVRVYGSFQDIDGRLKAQINAKAALEERNVILESIGDAFFAVDKNWVVTYWNIMAEKVLGKPRAKILYNNLWDVFADSVDSESYRQYHLAVSTNRAVHFEDYYAPLEKWYEISAYPSINGLSVYIKDITTRKLTEHRLIDSEKRYSELFHSSPLPKMVFAKDTLMFLDVNNSALAHYGYSRDEFLSMTIKDIRPPEDVPALQAILEERGKSSRFNLPGTIRHKKKTGEIIFVEIKSNDIDYRGIDARVIVANDVTERLHYVEAIEQQNEKLKEISWMQSHIIRAPLARIMGLLPLLDDARDSEEARTQILNYLKISADELDNVIRNITNMTGIVPYQ
ncbi:PAS domain S-box protein [Mucilaginibacter psychrotolerans]|uniref:histidine kinase n=1 Tax=Mucilaginibacter psychrotolerans TaxID=1524096 RepID=A0A4Y8SND8_9SPHI|nr:PAS domain S-box protein [Mucilaginibacter psychrotolerans]TFF40352.1 PAS domain S-box protein [Mucilaginibacter psychrotolerans]